MGWNTGRHAEATGKKGSKASHAKDGYGLRPDRSTKPLPTSAHPDPEQGAENPPPANCRTGIVSVNGQDVGLMHCRRP